MQNLWGSCVDWGVEDVSAYVTDDTVVCPPQLQANLEVVKAFFEKNHQDYLARHGAKRCETTVPEKPTFNFWEAMMHIYGWVPFNEGCGADANPLAETSIAGWDHAKTQSMYIHELQYNYLQSYYVADPKLELLFNPYVQLIHKDLRMSAYGFSVDDAVGFMSELGDGLVFTVGGPHGLENQQQFNYADGFSVAIGVPGSVVGSPNKPLIKKYGVCVIGNGEDPNCEKDKQDVVMPDNSQIAGFRVGSVVDYPIHVRFTDLNDNLYFFQVNEKFAACTDAMDPATCPVNKVAIVDKNSCLVSNSKGEKHLKSNEWCINALPNQKKEKQLTKNYISFPQLVDFL